MTIEDHYDYSSDDQEDDNIEVYIKIGLPSKYANK